MPANFRFWVAVGLLFGAAVLLHAVSHGEPPADAHPLVRFPAAFGNWQSRDLPLDKEIIEAVGVDDYVSRIYSQPAQAPVLLYIGYYKTQRTGVTIHSPKNCLPGSGWEPVTSSRLQVRAPDGNPATVNFYVIEKGLDRQLVLYWYQSHGRIIASEYWGKIYMVLDALRLNRTDAALVRVTSPVFPDEPQSQARLARFAEQILPATAGISPK